MIEFTDTGNDLYQCFLNRKQLDTIDFRLTDAQGRTLAQMDPEQARLQLFNFRMAIRWDLFPAPIPSLAPSRLTEETIRPDNPLRF